MHSAILQEHGAILFRKHLVLFHIYMTLATDVCFQSPHPLCVSELYPLQIARQQHINVFGSKLCNFECQAL